LAPAVTGHATPDRAASWCEVDFFGSKPQDDFTTQVQAVSMKDAGRKARENFSYASTWPLKITLITEAARS
jgi:hypothetical protein